MAKDPDGLRRRAAMEQRRLEELIAVEEAESVVAGARAADLAAGQRAARRRLAAARGALTRARHDGSPERIAAAARRVQDAHAEFDRTADAAVDERLALNRAQADHLGQVQAQLGRAWDAHAAADRAQGLREASR